MTTGSFAIGEYFLLAAHVSELPSPCSQNANPYSCRKLHEGARLRRVQQKREGTRVQISRVDPRGIVLDFCSTFWILSEVTSRKNLRSPFAKQLTGLFCSLRSIPLLKGFTKKERARICVPSLFWWTRGELNPCPKTS